ncbi:MAG: AraC family transcriptional regulator [Victivallaceae bacterium]|jgi:AraC-like DNA-binding protein
MLWSSKGSRGCVNPPHRHTMHELFICLNDNGIQYIEGRSCQFMRGRAFLLPEGSSHYIAAEPDVPAEYIFVCFEREHFLKSGNSQMQQAVDSLAVNRQYFSGADPRYLEENIRLINQLFEEIKESRPFASAQTDCLLGELIINYYRSLNQSGHGDNPAGMEKIQQLIKKIQRHPEADYPLERSARNAGMSITGFCEKFRQYTGTTLTGYIQAARLKKAIVLLQTTNLQIAVIALDCGFNNLGYFHKVFKKHYNVTPYALKMTFRQKGEFPNLLKEY